MGKTLVKKSGRSEVTKTLEPRKLEETERFGMKYGENE